MCTCVPTIQWRAQNLNLGGAFIPSLTQTRNFLFSNLDGWVVVGLVQLHHTGAKNTGYWPAVIGSAGLVVGCECEYQFPVLSIKIR